LYITLLNSISINNKYLTIHNKIIERAKTRANSSYEAKKLLGHCEGHHIVPKSFNLGGEKDSRNLVYLTTKEHILVHRLLCKFTIGSYRISSLRAYHAMCFLPSCNNRKASLHELAKAREAASLANRGKRGMSVPKWFGEEKTLEEFKQTLEEHVANKLSDPQIGKIYGVSATTIHNWRKKLGINKRRWQLSDKDWLEDKYCNHKLSCQDIADILGCTGSAVQLAMKKFGISIRNVRERQQNVDKERRGYFPAKDKQGNKYVIKKDDPRYLSGELVGLHKDTRAITDGTSIKYLEKDARLPEGWYFSKS
jgi:hypothetical protein